MMYSKKVLIFTPKSLYKVRAPLSRLNSLHNLFNSIRTAQHPISTATERTVFQTESSEFNSRQNEQSIDYGHNPDRFYKGYQNRVDFQVNSSGGSSDWGGNRSTIPGNGSAQNGFGGMNYGHFQQSSLREVGQGGNFNGFGREGRNFGLKWENIDVLQRKPTHHSENAQSEIYRGGYGADPNVADFPKNANGYPIQQNANHYQHQQTANNYQFQPTANNYQFQRTANNYQGQFQQTANGNQFQERENASGYHPENNWQDPNSSPRGVADFKESDYLKPGGETAETLETNKCEGTVEELDSFCKEGEVKKAVEVLGLLEKQGIELDLPRFFELMKACGEVSSLQEAKLVHDHLIRSLGGDVKLNVYNQILEMYCKCGSMPDALEVFDKMPERNLTTWDTMIMGLAKNGHGEDAVDLFTQFKESGLRPDGEMFFAVFYACSVLGDIDEGIAHFESMSKVYGITPSMCHYVKAVDMLGSTGYLDETMEFIEKMPVEPSVEVWETMMNLCRVHGNTELGDHCTELVEHLDPSRLSEQSKAGLVPVKPSDVAKEKARKKLASQNLLEVRSRVHEYRAGDKSHPEKDRIYALLRGMASQMKEAGYIPETRFVLHDIDQEGKEEALLAHSERLAVSYGLFSSPVRSPIRIIKNLRVCGDCHNALKIISKLVGRELIIRDAKRFHHFKDGLCSCRDYW